MPSPSRPVPTGHTGSQRPYVLLSCAMSVDGYIDDSSPDRLVLSSAEDLDRVDEVRSGCDAILIGANTIRRDNPRLLVNSSDRRARRVAHGQPAYPTKVTITASGLDPALKFFQTGGDKLVYCPSGATEQVRAALGEVAQVVPAGDPLDLARVLADLHARGVGRLMVEGGSSLHTQFLTGGLADELHLVVAPIFVGDPTAPRLVNPGSFPPGRLAVDEIRQVGDVVLIRYRLS